MAARRTIFLSYRHDDEPAVGRLKDRLDRHYKSKVFVDTKIPWGTRWPEHLRDTAKQCRILLAVIGQGWHAHAGRLRDPQDWVRQEVETALAGDVLTIPVLVDAARLPDSATLPQKMSGLIAVQAAELSNAHYDDDVRQLLGFLDAVLLLSRRRVATTAWATATTLLGGALMLLPVTAIPDPLPGLPALGIATPVLVKFVTGTAVLLTGLMTAVNARRWLTCRHLLNLPPIPWVKRAMAAALLLAGVAAVLLLLDPDTRAVVKKGETWNVRDQPSNSALIVDEASGGQEVVVDCVHDDGWAKLIEPWPGKFLHSNGLDMKGNAAPCL